MRAGLHYVPGEVRAVPGVTVKEHPFGYANTYTGTAEALVAAGLATPDMFPGQPGRPMTRASFRPNHQDSDNIHREEGYITIFRKAHSDNFMIERTVSKAEQQRRREERERADAKRQQNYAKLDQEQQQLQEELARASMANLQYKMAAGDQGAADAIKYLVRAQRLAAGDQVRLGNHLRVVWPAQEART